ncbi:hypothetical protein DFH28DRAFT_902275 [Melampsora americana]|nr:hypothetical protein DFH28DRAFT_902275 [Melampsora americana]
MFSEAVSREGVGHVINPTTSRERLLELLNHHVMRKKPRLSGKKSTGIKRSDRKRKSHAPVTTSKENNDLVHLPVIDFAQYDHSQLQQMLMSVGLETEHLDREELIRNCKIYNSLSEFMILELKPHTLKYDFSFRASASTSTPSQLTQQREVTEATYNTRLTKPRASTSTLPSLEHHRLAYPRPPPTQLAHGPSKNVRRVTSVSQNPQSESEYDPEEEKETVSDDNDASGSVTMGSAERDQRVEADLTTNASERSREVEDDDTAMNNAAQGDQAGLSNQIAQTNQCVAVLTSEVKSLTEVVRSFLGRDSKSTSPKKTIGGRTSDRIHFHVNTMLGITSVSDPLPRGASIEEQQGWMCNTDLNTLDIDPTQTLDTHQSADPCFPYKDGPGHPDSTPQQLQIIWRMMNVVGVVSFRPIFGESQTSGRNKWLWDLARRIFIKLVDCGVYSGISLDKKNLDYIENCFLKYIDTLKKRHRTQCWNRERQIAASTQTRRTSRLTYTRKTRLAIVHLYRELWPLIDVIKAASSDAETDPEDSEKHKKGQCCRVCELEWRSSELECVFIRLDSLKTRLDQSIPSTSSNASPRGCPSRPRVRSENRPISKIPAPDGLYKDCYSAAYQDGLSAGEKNLRGIKPQRILPSIIAVLDKLEQQLL